jgi:hypothetical protein
MNRSGVAALGIVGVVTAAIVGFVLWDEAKDSKRRTAEAAVVGFAATPQEWDEGGDDGIQKGHTLTFSWVDAASGVHTQTMERITWYDPGKAYHVCYNPQDPADHKLYPADHACGS